MKKRLNRIQKVFRRKARNRTRKTLVGLFDFLDEDNQRNVTTFVALGHVFSLLRSPPNAERAFRYAAFQSENPKHYVRLARTLNKQRKWWAELEALEEAVAKDATNPQWCYDLGTARERMSRYTAAAEAFQMAVELAPLESYWHYRLGYAQLQTGDEESAKLAFSEAIRVSTSPLASQLGVGWFHERRKYWPEAAQSYRAQAEETPTDPELHYRAARAFERSYQFDDAAHHLRASIALDDTLAVRHARLGLVLECAGRPHEAVANYERAIQLDDEKELGGVHFRLGRVLADSGRVDEAVAAFARMPEATPPSSHWFPTFRMNLAGDSGVENEELHSAQAFERNKSWDAASHALERGIAQLSTFEPKLYKRLGALYAAAGQNERACNAYSKTRIYQQAQPGQGFGLVPRHTTPIVAYVEYCDSFPLRENIVLYESYGGRSISGNPFALFCHVLDSPQFSNLTHVWIVTPATPIPSEYRIRENVIFIQRDSDSYSRYLATAQFLVNNSTFPTFFSRRKGQMYLNTWHGTPLKTMGKDIKTSFLERKNTVRNFLHTTHLLSPNKHTTHILTDRYEIQDTFSGIVTESGYPRIDLTLNATAEERRILRRSLGVSDASKVVLYAPTFRGTFNSTRFDTKGVEECLNTLLELDCHVLFRGHYFTESTLTSSTLKASVVPAHVDTNRLLSIVDVLVTDYSSIAFDFLATSRSTVHFIPDLEDYQNERGLCLPMDVLPGDQCFSLSELKASTQRALGDQRTEEQLNRYREAKARFCPQEDGCAGERVASMFFGGVDVPSALPASPRKSLLFHIGALNPNGITTSALNLFRNIDQEKCAVTLVIEPPAVQRVPARMELLEKFPESTMILGRAGRVLTSPEEKTILQEFSYRRDLPNSSMWNIFRHHYEREYRRMFGGAKFDTVINFGGYDLHWYCLFGAAKHSRAVRKVTYLHNNMHAECTLRFPSLINCFRTLDWYDSLISVSEMTAALNQQNLSSRFGIDINKFQFCDNVHDPEQTLRLADAPLLEADENLFVGPGPFYLTMGRLSPEKGHKKLITAFDRFHKDVPTARLFLLGDGPLLTQLSRQIADLSLESSVFLLGRRSNPFPLLKRADCFVLSSDHEGQPMVLFEALILGKPIVSTDIVGSRSVLEGRPGLLVKNSVDGLASGMRDLYVANFPSFHFNISSYQHKALKMFYDKVVQIDPIEERK